jgi:hypothetical protein
MTGMSMPYYPMQLITSEDGKRIIEQDRAPISYMRAAIKRERAELKRAQAKLPRGQAKCERLAQALFFREQEVDLFASWTDAEAQKGRARLDLTFGNFLRETGIWRPTESVH